MTSLLSTHSLSKAYGTQILFQEISFSVCSEDRIGIIGPNGAGKSSLIKILAGLEEPDSGSVSKRQKLRVGYASQSPQFPSMPIDQFLISQVPHIDEHTAETRAGILLGKAEFADFSMDASLLSGGWKKRLDIVRALMNEPELLLLDEPTNHLDLEGILWLENFLKKMQTPYVVISHDRYFLENVTNKIMELNKCYPEGILVYPGNLSAFMEQKDDFLNAQEKKEKELSFKVRKEVDWLRTSPKARTTKSSSRIQQAYKLIDEFSDVKMRRKVETVGIDFSASDRQTRKLLVANNMTKSLGGKVLFKGIDLVLSPGTRLGIVGKNGTGKTTMLKVMAGTIAQDMGTIKYADDLRIVYFDQHRENLPSEMTLKEALSPNGDTINYRGQSIHVNGWAKRFLFTPDRLKLPVRCLSGGERARILIAKLMLEPADILFLDEPTNDLDIETLEVIEESLLTFAGAVVLISHDRCMMDRLCTQILGLGENLEHQFFNSFNDWEESTAVAKKKDKSVKAAVVTEQREKTKKLTYSEKKELEKIEGLISEAEASLEKMHNEVNNQGGSVDAYKRLGEAQEKLDKLFSRWQELLDKSN
jgi:ATP-binding cassette subfamily F protein uup